MLDSKFAYSIYSLHVNLYNIPKCLAVSTPTALKLKSSTLSDGMFFSTFASRAVPSVERPQLSNLSSVKTKLSFRPEAGNKLCECRI